MSTNRAQKPGQRQADYSNIGIVGRKTGAVLKDTGARDQYGLPDIDDLFSSPQRVISPVRSQSPNGAAYSSIAETLVTASNSLPNPSQHSSPRRAPPPRARSPIKTSLGSPRKSLNSSPAKTGALLQSPVRIGRVQDRSSQEPTAFADNKHKRRSLEQAPKRPAVSLSASKRPAPNLQAPRRSLFEHPSSPVAQPRTNGELSRESVLKAAQERFHVNGQRLGNINVVQQKKESPRVNGRGPHPSSEGELFVRQDVVSPVATRKDPELPLLGSDQPISQPISTKAKGKRRFDEIEAEERDRAAKKLVVPIVQVEQPADNFEPFDGGFDDGDYEPVAPIVEEEERIIDEEDEVEELPPPKTHLAPFIEASDAGSSPLQTRSPAKKRPPAWQDDPQEEPAQPSKKPKISPAEEMPPPAKPAVKARGRPPKDKNADIATMFGKPVKKHPAAKSTRSPPPPPPPPLGNSRPKARGLQIVRGDDAPEIDGAKYTRSGRTSVKPVEYWRGERVVYTEPKREGGRVSLPGIKEVIRVEEDEPPRMQYKSRKQKRKARQESNDQEDGEPQQEWEVEPGVFAGEVPSWDAFEQTGDPEYPEQVDLAIAPSGLKALTKAVPDATFNYAKTITLPFFHSGLVEIPPGGEKKQKLSRRNHIVFWVFEGRVMVNVSGNEFSLGRGGMWQVPRGNSYAISNPYERTARIFFSQGCYMTEEEGAAREDAEAEAQAQTRTTGKGVPQQD